MELRFLPTSLGTVQPAGHHQPPPHHPPSQNNNFEPTACDSPRRTLERSTRNLQQQQQFAGVGGGSGDIGIPLQPTDRAPSLRRTPRRTPTGGTGQGIPSSPMMRIRGGVSSDMLHHNRSPLPTRVAHSGKRNNRLGSRNNENISSASLNSIEV